VKYVVLVADGMADEPIAELNGKTPLEHARTPHLDRMASLGILGLTRTVPAGLPPGSDVGMLSVLGFDPARYQGGRAALEAASLGVRLGPDDVALRCNLVTLETPEGGAELLRDFAGGHPSAAEGRELVADLARVLGRGAVEFHAGRGYRHLAVWRNGDTGVRTAPPYEVTDKPVAAALPDGPGAEVLRDLIERSRALLTAHPICQARRAREERAPNAIWFWGQGKRLELPRFRVPGAVVSASDLVRGLGVLAYLRPIDVPGATGFLDTDLRAKVTHGLRALADRAFLLLHVAAPDEASHLGDAQRKVEAIERFDEQVVAGILEGLRATGAGWRVLVVPDHASPCAQRGHSAEPVPFIVYTSNDESKPQGVSRGYSEREARDQGVFIAEAHTLLDRLLRP